MDCDNYLTKLILVVILALAVSCGVCYGQQQSISISPLSVTVPTNNTQQFTARTTGLTIACIIAPCYQVAWAVNGVVGGNATVGRISVDGVYTAPSAVPAPSTVTLTAISIANSNFTASAQVTITAGPPIQVAISPTSLAADPGVFYRFFATVTGSTNTTVTWEVNGITGGNVNYGTISQAGGYTAPLTKPNPNLVSVTARSAADPTKSATATVTIQSVQYFINPLDITVQRNGTQQFMVTSSAGGTPTVRWSVNGIVGGNAIIGTISATGLYTAPAQIPMPATVTVAATNTTDPALSASTTVTIQFSIQVAIAPVNPVVELTTNQQFTATVTGTTNTGVTWFVNSIQGGNSQVGTISPFGFYVAPTALPNPSTVLVSATSVADPSRVGLSSVTLVPLPVITSASSLPSGTVGASYNQSFFATGGYGAYTWSLASGTLPPGLTLNPIGILSGVPAAAGVFSFTLGVADSKTFTASKNFQVAITGNPNAPFITLLQPSFVRAGDPGFTLNISGTNFIKNTVGVPTVRWNGMPVSSQYLSPVSMTVQVSASMIAAAGAVEISVANPAVGGAVFTSNPATLAVLPPLSGSLVPSSGSFQLADRAMLSIETAGGPQDPAVGYGVITPNTGSTAPAGVAIFGFRENNILVSQAGVPASPPLSSGRIYAEINETVNTGVAIANPGAQLANLSFEFTDSAGNSVSGNTTIAPGEQVSAFLNEAPFNGSIPFQGSFTFRSSVPVYVIALRGLTNQRHEFLVTTLPLADLASSPSTDPLVFPYFADGAGWATQIVLVNPGDAVLTGIVQFLDNKGQSVSLSASGQTGSSFSYSIPPRSSQKLTTAGLGAQITYGSARVIPSAGTSAPSGLAIFSYTLGGVTVTEAGVPSAPAGNAFRLYADATGDFVHGASGAVQTGISVANASTVAGTAKLELFNSDGSSTGLSGTLSIPALGQTAAFLDEIPGLSSLQLPFQGELRISSASGISVVGLLGAYNERREFLITTTPSVNEATAPISGPFAFPDFIDSGGYTTQFILFSKRPSSAVSGNFQLFTKAGARLNVSLTGGVAGLDAMLPVQIGDEVPAAVRNTLTVSTMKGAPSIGPNLQVAAATSGDTIAIAMDSAGNTFLLGLGTGNSIRLDARSTAIAMVRIALDSFSPRDISTAQLNQAIQNAPSFDALFNLITARLKQGVAPVESDDTVQLAIQVCDEVTQNLNTAAANNSRPISSAAQAEALTLPLPYYFVKSALEGENLWLDDVTGPGVNLFNDTRLDWHASSQDTSGNPIGEAIMPRLPYNFWSFIPYYSPPTITSLQGNSSKFMVTVDQNNVSRTNSAVTLFTSFGLFAIGQIASAKSLDDKYSQCFASVSKAILTDRFPGLLTQQDGAALMAYINSVLPSSGSMYDLATYFYNKASSLCVQLPSWQDVPSGSVTKLVSIWWKLKLAEGLSVHSVLMYQIQKYWSFSKTVQVCKTAGAITKCPPAITINPQNPFLAVDSTVQLQVVAKDENGAVVQLPTPATIQWSSDNPSIATVDQNGSAKGVSAGTAKISASIPALDSSASTTITVTKYQGGEVFTGTIRIVDGACSANFTLTMEFKDLNITQVLQRGGTAIGTFSYSVTSKSCPISWPDSMSNQDIGASIQPGGQGMFGPGTPLIGPLSFTLSASGITSSGVTGTISWQLTMSRATAP